LTLSVPAVTPSISIALNNTGSADAGSMAHTMEDSDSRGATIRVVIIDDFIFNAPEDKV
jgi:hypothetical protein